MVIALHVDRTEPLPIHTQLAEQVRYHIEVGAWEPGHRLSTVRFLAGSLGVNYNTVRAVYRELEREGYVVTQQGRGTFVASKPPTPPDQRERIEALIDGVLLEADRMGVSAQQFARLSYLRAKAFRQGASAVPLLFVECCPAEVAFHAREILQATGVRPMTLLVKDLATLSAPSFDRFSIIATTLFHVTEVQKALGPGRRVQGLLVEPSPSDVVDRLRPLPRGARVAILCSSRRNARRMQHALMRVGLTHLKYWSVPIDAPSEIKRAFREADEVLISRRILSEHKGPWPTNRVFHEYVDVLPSASLQLLRRRIAEAAQGEAGRSAEGAVAEYAAGGESLKRLKGPGAARQRHA